MMINAYVKFARMISANNSSVAIGEKENCLIRASLNEVLLNLSLAGLYSDDGST